MSICCLVGSMWLVVLSALVIRMPPGAWHISWKLHWLRVLPLRFGLNFAHSFPKKPSVGSPRLQE